jgi:hypothetical protein
MKPARLLLFATLLLGACSSQRPSVMSFIGGTQDSAPGAAGYVLQSDLLRMNPEKNRTGKLPLQL